MEFASEMVIKAALAGMRMTEVPITLHKDGRSRPPHLRPWRDGWRHLRFMLIYSPRWLFLAPGLFLVGFGGLSALIIYRTPVQLGQVNLDAGTLVIACMCVIIGVQFVALSAFAKVFGIGEGLLPPNAALTLALERFSLEKGLIAGFLIFVLGVGLLGWAVWVWMEAGFQAIPYEENLRRVMAAATCMMVGLQIMSASWFLSVLGLKTKSRPEPPGDD